jgi:hypothetical protein
MPPFRREGIWDLQEEFLDTPAADCFGARYELEFRVLLSEEEAEWIGGVELGEPDDEGNTHYLYLVYDEEERTMVPEVDVGM